MLNVVLVSDIVVRVVVLTSDTLLCVVKVSVLNVVVLVCVTVL